LFCFIVSNLVACGQNTKENYAAEEYVPKNHAVEINLQLGVEYMRLGRNDLALTHLTKSLKLDNNYAQSHSAIAILYQQLGLKEEAENHYQQALKLKPQDSDIQNNYGQFLCEQGKWQEATQQFQQALENPIYQTPEIPYTNAGLCALRHKEMALAESYFRQALEKNPKFARTLYLMAHLSFTQNHYLTAQNYLRRYEEVAKHTPETLWLGIRIERAMGDREAEAKYVLSLHKLFPDSQQAKWLNQSSSP
jgi:type IV pilus assembly protein PilF